MKKAKIYLPSKTATQSINNINKKWILEFNKDGINNDFLMNWVSSNNTQSQVKLFFSNKGEAIAYAKKNNIDFELIEPKKNKLIIKSYADNFLS